MLMLWFLSENILIFTSHSLRLKTNLITVTTNLLILKCFLYILDKILFLHVTFMIKMKDIKDGEIQQRTLTPHALNASLN